MNNDRAAGNWLGVASDWQNVLKSNPTYDKLIYFEIGKAYEKAGDPASAREAYKHFLSDNQPVNNDAFNNNFEKESLLRLAALDCQEGDWKGALDAYNRATKEVVSTGPNIYKDFDPTKPDLVGLELSAYILDGYYECMPGDTMLGTADAMDRFKKAYELEPSNEVAQFYYAYGLWFNHDEADGVALMTKLRDNGSPDISKQAAQQLIGWTHFIRPTWTVMPQSNSATPPAPAASR